MKWGDFELYWGRPLKSIYGIFDNKKLTFQFSSFAKFINLTFVDKDFEDKKKNI